MAQAGLNIGSIRVMNPNEVNNVFNKSVPAGATTNIQKQSPGIGVKISEPDELHANGVDTANENIQNEGSWSRLFIRFFVEFAAVLAFSTIMAFAVATNTQESGDDSSQNIALIQGAYVGITVLLFSYATGVALSPVVTIAVTVSRWVLTAMKKEEVRGMGTDTVTALFLIIAQIAGNFVGPLIAELFFLDNGASSFDTIMERFVPHFGPATWLPPLALVTSWQASVMVTVASFIVVSAALYEFAVPVFQDSENKKNHKIWAAFLRGGAHALISVLFFVPVGAAVDVFRWVATAAMADMSQHVGNGEAWAFALAPWIGMFLAMLFLWLWAWLSDYLSAPSGGYKKL